MGVNLTFLDEEVMMYLSQGYRLCRPSYWRDSEVWSFIVEMWHKNPIHRPTFIKIYEFFKVKHMAYAKYEGIFFILKSHRISEIFFLESHVLWLIL